MPAPNDNTPISIINDAYFDAGLTQEGQVPNSEQVVMGMRKLTDIVNLWQTQGLKLWLNQDYPVTLTAGQGTYTFGPAGTSVMAKPPRVIDAYYEDVNHIRRPLIPLSWNEFNRLSQVNQTGQINSYFVDKKCRCSLASWVRATVSSALSLHLRPISESHLQSPLQSVQDARRTSLPCGGASLDAFSRQRQFAAAKVVKLTFPR